MFNSTPKPDQHTYVSGYGFCYDHEARGLIEAELNRLDPSKRSKIKDHHADFDSAFGMSGRYCVYAGAIKKGKHMILYYSC